MMRSTKARACCLMYSAVFNKKFASSASSQGVRKVAAGPLQLRSVCALCSLGSYLSSLNSFLPTVHLKYTSEQQDLISGGYLLEIEV